MLYGRAVLWNMFLVPLVGLGVYVWREHGAEADLSSNLVALRNQVKHARETLAGLLGDDSINTYKQEHDLDSLNSAELADAMSLKVKDLERELEISRQTIERLETQLQDAENSAENGEALTRINIENKNVEIANLNAVIDKLRRKVDKYSRKIDNLQNKADEDADKIKDLQNKAVEDADKIKKLEAKIRKLNGKVKKCKKPELPELDDAITKLKSSADELKGSITRFYSTQFGDNLFAPPRMEDSVSSPDSIKLDDLRSFIENPPNEIFEDGDTEGRRILKAREAFDSKKKGDQRTRDLLAIRNGYEVACNLVPILEAIEALEGVKGAD